MQDWGRMGHAKTAKIRRNLTGLVASHSRYGPPRASNPSKAKSAYTNAFIIRRSERHERKKEELHPSSQVTKENFHHPTYFRRENNYYLEKPGDGRVGMCWAGGAPQSHEWRDVAWGSITCFSAHAIHPRSVPSPFIW